MSTWVPPPLPVGTRDDTSLEAGVHAPDHNLTTAALQSVSDFLLEAAGETELRAEIQRATAAEATLETEVDALQGADAVALDANVFRAQTGTTYTLGLPGVAFGPAGTAAAPTVGRIYYQPFRVKRAIDIVELSINASVAASAGGTALFALAKLSDSGQSNDRLYLSSAIVTTTTGAIRVTTGLPTGLGRGRYALCLLCLTAAPTLRHTLYLPEGMAAVGSDASFGLPNSIHSLATSYTTIADPPAADAIVATGANAGIPCYIVMDWVPSVVPVTPPPVPPIGGGTTIIVSPGETIASKIVDANPGDTVLVKNGTYPQQTFARTSSGVGVTVKGETRTGVVINGLVMNGCQYVTVDNLTVAGTVAGVANMKAGVLLLGSTTDHLTFQNLTVQPTSVAEIDSTPCFAIRDTASFITVQDCYIDGSLARGGQGRGFYLYGGNVLEAAGTWVHDIIVRRNIIRGVSADCFFVQGAYNVEISDNPQIGYIQLNADRNNCIQIVSGRNVDIRRNIFEDAAPFGVDSVGVFQAGRTTAGGPVLVTSDIEFTDNTTTRLGGNGLNLSGITGTTLISGNKFQNLGQGSDPVQSSYGLSLQGGITSAVTGETLPQNENLSSSNVFGNNFGAGGIFKDSADTSNLVSIQAANSTTG